MRRCIRAGVVVVLVRYFCTSIDRLALVLTAESLVPIPIPIQSPPQLQPQPQPLTTKKHGLWYRIKSTRSIPLLFDHLADHCPRQDSFVVASSHSQAFHLRAERLGVRPPRFPGLGLGNRDGMTVEDTPVVSAGFQL
jgi:hypothetical protein